MAESNALSELQDQMVKISAENLAMQFVLTCLLQRLGALNVGSESLFCRRSMMPRTMLSNSVLAPGQRPVTFRRRSGSSSK